MKDEYQESDIRGGEIYPPSNEVEEVQMERLGLASCSLISRQIMRAHCQCPKKKKPKPKKCCKRKKLTCKRKKKKACKPCKSRCILRKVCCPKPRCKLRPKKSTKDTKDTKNTKNQSEKPDEK